ncbi:cobalamin biosynthesis protein [Leptolyngbya sp. GGD]|uniref:cobalamin biosynthesis protein n=1 Tax=Leptolyngbya sp. GGD TaxID=2997907 RepID=UPI00227A92BD|nr:cobalamin biosynthesis protein [Leptolyngbya sp. GGD]MCY6491450.1 cobalamin biosynthesis protein [Leptolyngbya sp. GGD]
MRIRTQELFDNWLNLKQSSLCLWIGIGCRRGATKLIIQTAIDQVLDLYQLEHRTIAGIATLDRKSDEIGLVEYCRDHDLPLRCFSADRLSTIAVPNPSLHVAMTVQTSSVAEAAAMCAAQTQILIVPKQVIQGVTIAIAESSLQ